MFGVILSAFFLHFLALLSLRIQSKCGENAEKMGTRITPNTDPFYALSIKDEIRRATFLIKQGIPDIR